LRKPSRTARQTSPLGGLRFGKLVTVSRGLSRRSTEREGAPDLFAHGPRLADSARNGAFQSPELPMLADPSVHLSHPLRDDADAVHAGAFGSIDHLDNLAVWQLAVGHHVEGLIETAGIHIPQPRLEL
jgi:hypothetical protein